MKDQTTTKAPSGRPSRKPVGTRNRLTVDNKDPNYHYRLVNDVDERVAMFQEGGYEVASLKDHKLGSASRVDTGNTADNTLSVGGGTKAVLMRINKDWYEEDQQEKQKKVDATMDSLKTPALDGSYGQIQVTK